MKSLLIAIVGAVFLAACSPSEPGSSSVESPQAEMAADDAMLEENAGEPAEAEDSEDGALEPSENGQMSEEQRKALAREVFEALGPRILAAAMTNDTSKRAALFTELRAGVQKLSEHSEPEFVGAVQEEVWRTIFDTPDKRERVDAYLRGAPPTAAPASAAIKAPSAAPPPLPAAPGGAAGPTPQPTSAR